jgi:hypothetical protein
LEGVIKGGNTTTSLINLIMGSIMEKGGVLKSQIIRKFLFFGANGTFVMQMSFITYFSLVTTCKLTIDPKFTLFKGS